MKKKKKAFTLLELIITLSITVVVLGTIYTFFLTNSKTIISTEISSDLQIESQNIQNEILKYGTESNKITSLNGNEIKDSNKVSYSILDPNGQVDVSEITFEAEGYKYKFTFDNSSGVFTVRKNLEEIVELSKNIEELKIRPLDYRMKGNGNFYEANGAEISFVLKVKKGYSDVTIPSSVIVKFRNKL